MLMLVAVRDARFGELDAGLQAFSDDAMVVTTRPTLHSDPGERVGWLPYSVSVNGADHQGIIHHFSELLAERGVNVESMDTETVFAPMSGTSLFTMEAIVLVPPDLDLSQELEGVADEMNVEMEPYTGK